MSGKRFIEITASSEKETRSLVSQERNDSEHISGEEILTAPTKGIFGVVGNPEYRIRFTIEAKPEPEPEPEPVREPVREPQREVYAPSDAYDEEDGFGDDFDDEEPAPNREGQHAPRPDRKRGGERGRSSRGPRRERGPRPEPIHVEMPEKEEVTDEIRENPLYAEIMSLVKEVAAMVGVDDIELTDYVRDGAWVVEASGDNVAQLIGKHGRTLDALQYVLNIMLNKGKDDRLKLVLDAQGYREKRYRNLIQLANRMYRKVLDGGRQVELEPMSTLDRRTVHLALKDRQGIETFSRGIEPMRRVVITPNRKGGGGGRNSWRRQSEERRDEAPRQVASRAVPMFIEEDHSDES